MRGRVATPLVLVIWCVATACGAWRNTGFPVLVRESTTILVGTLIGDIVKGDEESRVGLGVLYPRRWILHPGRTQEILLFGWQEGAKKDNQGLEFDKYQGRTGLWLLLDDVDGTVSANYRQSFMKESEAERVVEEIVRNPLRVVLVGGTKKSATAIRFLLSNPGMEPLTAPWIQDRGDKVEWPGGLEVVLLHKKEASQTSSESDPYEPYWYWSLRGKEDEIRLKKDGWLKIEMNERNLIRLPFPTSIRLPAGDFSKRELGIRRLFDLPSTGEFILYVTSSWGWRSNTLRFTAEQAN